MHCVSTIFPSIFDNKKSSIEYVQSSLFYAVRNLKLTEDYKKLPAIERQLVLDNEKEIFSLLKTK